MGNTLTNLSPDIYVALDTVSRELVGFIPSVMRDPSADRVALNQTLRSPYTSKNTAGGNVTPAMSIPSALDQAILNKTLTLTKSRFYGFSWSGEEENTVNQGPGALTVQQDQIAQCFRALVNEMESDLVVAAALGASRAYGTAGTTPFASGVGDGAQLRKILDDNGAPKFGRSAIIDTTCAAVMRTNSQLTKVNEIGDAMSVRDGEILNIHGLSFKESAAITPVVAGAMTGALFNGAGAVGDTTITFDTGTVNTTGIKAGDVVSITGTTGGAQKYVVATGTTSTSGTFTIAAPGLLYAVADNTAISVIATSTRNVAFSQNAIVLATRLPVAPSKKDLATAREIVTDPRTGLTFEIVEWPGADMITYHVRICWGIMIAKPEHIALLLG